MKIKEYFTDKELECKCGCGKMPDERFVEKLYAMRLTLNFPFFISSGARCVAHNRKKGGAKSSTHLQGAVDISKYQPWMEGLIIEAAIKVGMTGIGFKDNKFIHLDDKHDRLTFWGY